MENFLNPPLLGTANALQLSNPVGSSAASPTGSITNFSGVSAPAVGSIWQLPSATGTSFQPLLGSAYLCQHSSTMMLSGVTDQSQISTSAPSYTHVLDWDITGSTEKSSCLECFTRVTLTNQHAGVSSTPMAAQCDQTADANAMVALFPSLTQGMTSQIPNQGCGLSLSYQQANQLCYSNPGTVGPPVTGELGTCLQSYGSVTHTESVASVPYSEMVMVLRDIQPTQVLPPALTSEIYIPVYAHPVTRTSFQVMENSLGMQTSLGLQPPRQTFCLSQTAEFPRSCRGTNIQVLDSDPTSELEDTSMIATIQSPSRLLPLLPGPFKEKTENNDLEEILTKLPEPPDTIQSSVENQDPPLLPLGIPDIQHLLDGIDPLVGQKEQPNPINANSGMNIPSLEDKWGFQEGTEASNGLADITPLLEDICLPQIFSPLRNLDQSKVSWKSTNPGAMDVNQLQDKESDTQGLSSQVRKNKHKSTPKVKIQLKDPECLLEGEVVDCKVAASDGRSPINVAHLSNSKLQKPSSSKSRTTKSHRQEKATRTRDPNSEKPEESMQSDNKVKAEEKPPIPKTRRKRNPSEIIQETFKKPRSCLGMHMLESVQVFHALGKKTEKKTGLSSSRILGHSSNIQDLHASSATEAQLNTPQEGKGPEKVQIKAQKLDEEAENGCVSPSVFELPPPGKAKLVPLPFAAIEKPWSQPIPRKPQSLASCRPTAATHARSASSNTAESTAVILAQPAAASATSGCLAESVRPTSTKATQPDSITPIRPSLPPSAVSKPVSNKTSSYSLLKWLPVSTAGTNLQPPPKPQNPFLIQGFSCQPIPWRKSEILGPSVSAPITEEQRPEREAMKRRAQLERDNAAKYTSCGKLQFFIEREKEMDISHYYGYAM